MKKKAFLYAPIVDDLLYGCNECLYTQTARDGNPRG